MNKLTLDKLCSAAFTTYAVIFLLFVINDPNNPIFYKDHVVLSGVCTPFVLAFGYACAVGWKLLGKLHEKIFN